MSGSGRFRSVEVVVARDEEAVEVDMKLEESERGQWTERKGRKARGPADSDTRWMSVRIKDRRTLRRQ